MTGLSAPAKWMIKATQAAKESAEGLAGSAQDPPQYCQIFGRRGYV